MISNRRVSGSVVVCLLAWLALAAPWLWGTLTIPYDAKAHFQPQLQFLANALHHGQSPFWNPNVFAGSPQIADPQSLIFSPALLLAAISPAPGFRLLDAYVLALLACAALAIVQFFRARGWHPAGGIVAALAFAFGSSAAWRIQHIGQIQSHALFAIALWLVDRALHRKSPASGMWAGLACGLLLIEPNQVALMASYVLVGYALTHISAQPRPLTALRRSLPALSIAALTALLIAIVPMLLLAQFATGTSRHEIAFLEAARGSLHPASLLSLLIGDLYGAGTSGIDYWGPYSETWDPTNLTLSQNMTQLYIGALPALVLLSFGLVRGLAWKREIRFFTIAALISVVYGLGIYTPLFSLIYDLVPGVSFFRRPADATFLIGGLLAIVAGYLVHLVVSGAVKPASPRQRMAERGLIGALFVVAVGIAVREHALLKAVTPLLVSAAVLTTALTALWLVRQRELRSVRFSLPLLAALMTLDLAAINGPNESTALPAAQFDVLRPDTANKTIALLKTLLAQPPGSARRDRVELAGVGFEWPNAGMVHGFDHTLGYNPLRLTIVTTALGADDTVAGWDQRRFTPLFPSYHSLLADMMGLRYLVSGVPASTINPKLGANDLKLIAKTADGYIYENPRALPRAMFVPGWRLADFAGVVRSGAWPDGFDPLQSVLLEARPNVGPTPVLAAAPAASRPAGVRLKRYQNAVVEISVDSAQDGIVLLNDIWHPWWFATVDGKPADIMKANVMFRAVAVPAGRHLVRFTFEPLRGAWNEMLAKRSIRRLAPMPTPTPAPSIASPRL